MCPVAEAKLFFCNSFPHQQLIFRVSCGAAGSLTVNVFTQMQMDKFNIYFVEHPDNFETLWNQEWHSLSTNFQGQWCCTWVSDCMCWLNWPKCREREFFFITFHIHGFLSARWQRGGQCFFKILSYLWIFYQPGAKGGNFFYNLYIYDCQPGAKGGRCLGNKCPSFRYLGQRLLLLILLLLGLHNAVHHQCTRCIAEGAYIAVCSAMLNRSLMHCTVILHCNTLKYCTALLGVEVVV